MKALVYNGPRDVSVVEVPDAKLEKPTDALVRITTANICGSDLHMYEGRTDMQAGRILGHENLGEVIEVGNAVDRVKVGDRVCLPFNVGCGFCANCERGRRVFASPAIPAMPAPRMASPAWAPTRAGRPNTCACRMPTSTVWYCRRARRKRKTTT